MRAATPGKSAIAPRRSLFFLYVRIEIAGQMVADTAHRPAVLPHHRFGAGIVDTITMFWVCHAAIRH